MANHAQEPLPRNLDAGDGPPASPCENIQRGSFFTYFWRYLCYLTLKNRSWSGISYGVWERFASRDRKNAFLLFVEWPWSNRVRGYSVSLQAKSFFCHFRYCCGVRAGGVERFDTLTPAKQLYVDSSNLGRDSEPLARVVYVQSRLRRYDPTTLRPS